MDRRVIYSCLLAALLVAWHGPASAWAARGAAVERRAATAAAPRFEPGVPGGLPHGLPGPAILRGAGLPNLGLLELDGKTPIPTATPNPNGGTQPATTPGSSTPAASNAKPEQLTNAGQPSTPVPSLLTHNQMVVLYGVPGNADLGLLGAYSPEGAAKAALLAAARYDAINGSDGVTPTLDLVYAQVQAEPTDNSLYLRYLSNAVVRKYAAVADRYDVQLMLDLQIGRGDPLAEVRKIERFLINPRIQVAIDPEYAVGSDGIPLETPGAVSGDQINAIQDYLSGLAANYNLPPKVLVVHQYMEDTLTHTDQIRSTERVDLVFNMDAYGALDEKARKYSMFAGKGYAAHHGFNVFVRLDDRVMSEAEVQRLSPRPDVIFYQ